jgi:translation initiation factor IF-1
MKNQEITVVEGSVIQALPNTMFKVELEDGKVILASLKGKMRRSYIRVFPGDKVKVEMTHYDTERGRIVYKY